MEDDECRAAGDAGVDVGPPDERNQKVGRHRTARRQLMRPLKCRRVRLRRHHPHSSQRTGRRDGTSQLAAGHPTTHACLYHRVFETDPLQDVHSRIVHGGYRGKYATQAVREGHP